MGLKRNRPANNTLFVSFSYSIFHTAVVLPSDSDNDT